MLDKGNVVFGSWIVEETIGSGAFGTVYKIKREEYGNDVYAAMKVVEIPQDKEEHNRLRREGMDDESISQYYSQIAQNFIKEIEFLSSFDGITNIVEYQDHIIESNDNMGYTIYIKMQLLTPLARLLLNGDGSARFMDVGEVLRLGKDICSALEVCEKRNIIHRDIKIDNIFISEDGNYKLGDFGIAKQLEATQGEMSKKGTMLYMAPEVFRGENYDRTVDIYSLGIVLYRLLNKNRAPFFPNYPDPIRFSDKETANARRLRGDVFPDIIGVSEELNAIFKKACALNPRDRYQSAGELRAALESIAIAPVAPTAVVSVANISADDESTVGVFSGVPSANRSADDESTVGVFSGVSSVNRSADDESTVGVFSGVPSANRSADDEATVGVFGGVPSANRSADDEATVGVLGATPVTGKDIDEDKTESVFTPAYAPDKGIQAIKTKENESSHGEENLRKSSKKSIIAIIAVIVVIAIVAGIIGLSCGNQVEEYIPQETDQETTQTVPTLNEDGYYEIYSAEDLLWFADEVNSGNNRSANAILMNDIDLDGYEWKPICGAGNSEGGYYCGIFDGNGYTIRNITCNMPEAYSVGFIGQTYIDSVIKNLTIENGFFQGYECVGGIVGFNFEDSTIENCSFNGEVIGVNYVGGIAGDSWSIINYCYFHGSVEGAEYVGGIAGCSREISFCEVFGNVKGADYVGGIVGSISYGKVYSCGVFANVVGGASPFVGSIVGYDDCGVIEECYEGVK